jgi:hypothetical protein
MSVDDNTVQNKKRGRKKKVTESTPPSPPSFDEPANITIELEEPASSTIELVEHEEKEKEREKETNKKRGRKPKGGKLVMKQSERTDDSANPVNIILHLKCSMSDFKSYDKEMTQMVTDPLAYNPIAPPNIMSYIPENQVRKFSYYMENDSPEQDAQTAIKPLPSDFAYNIDLQQYKPTAISSDTVCQKCNSKFDKPDDEPISMKDVNAKLKSLKIQLYKNQLQDKKSACFWCTYEFDSPPCYIPRYEMDDEIHGYGSFCRPECAVAYLMKESMDDSTKFEQYHLLNQIYSRVYNYKKNIKPAPDPHYLLDKFYGTLTIQEYRKLLKSDHMLLIIDKPMTRILPELHDDNENFVLNIFGGKPSTTTGQQNGMYKVKRESEKQKGPTKNSIMRDKFGLNDR